MLTAKKWQRILVAKALLHLPDQATLPEIKAAYRKLCKEHHPDLAPGAAERSVVMQEINAAYAVLLDYCAGYRFPLVPPSSEAGVGQDPEDWWLDRFGEDPLWGRKREK